MRSLRLHDTGSGMWLIPAFLAFFLFGAMPARAATCYTPEAFEAEQGLRLHADMEVIMLTCKYDGYKRPLSSHYTKFMKKNSRLIKGWEDIIARIFADTGSSRSEVIDNFRTYLANRRSHEASVIGARTFCVNYANFLITAGDFTPEQLMNYVRQFNPAFPPKLPPCAR